MGEWIHWIVHDIPSEVRSIPTGEPVVGMHLKNDFEVAKWVGPAPPFGTHRYIFTLCALKTKRLASAQKSNIRQLCEAGKLASAQLIGMYTEE